MYFFVCPGIIKNQSLIEKPDSYFFTCYIVISSTFCYLLFFIFRNFYSVHDDTDAFFIFLIQKDFYIFHERIETSCFFFFRKILILSRASFRSLSLFFLIVSGSHFYVCDKIFNWFFILIFYVVCFYSSEFSSSVFSSSEFISSDSSLSDSSEEMSISLIIYLAITFSLTTYLHSSRNTWE